MIIPINEIENRFQNIYNDEYVYDWSTYTGVAHPMKMTHRKCNDIVWRTPHNHYTWKHTCFACDRIEKFQRVHGDEYEYDWSTYKEPEIPMRMKHRKCGHWFWKTPYGHMKGTRKGCPRCRQLEKFERVHGDEYEYDWSTLDEKTKHMKMQHKKCGHWFWQSKNNHLSGKGCPDCKKHTLRKLKATGNEMFIKQSQKRFGDVIDFSMLNYFNRDTEVQLKCKIKDDKGIEHGWYFITPRAHLRGLGGCPKCTGTWGENFVSMILGNLNLEFKHQKTFKDCKDKHKLKFDFYLIYLNILIEYDGIQHFKAIQYFGGEKALKETQRRDEIKNKYCRDYNIPLLRVNCFMSEDEIIKKVTKFIEDNS
jgi:predicted  nucleic acid-binding Zn-ribbon protein